MTPRDDRVNAAYWDDAFRVLERDIEKFRPFSHNFRSDDVRAGSMRTTANLENVLFLLGARYSAGAPVLELAADVESAVTVWETWNRYAAVTDAGFPLDSLEFDNKSTYYNALWLSSVARCIGVAPELMDRLLLLLAVLIQCSGCCWRLIRSGTPCGTSDRSKTLLRQQVLRPIVPCLR